MNNSNTPFKQPLNDLYLNEKENEKFIELLIENSAAAIAVFDTEMRYILTSKRWLSDFKIVDKSITGKSHYEVFPDISEEWKEVHRKCLQGQGDKREEECFYRADGSVEWVKWEVKPWYKTEEEIGGIILFTEVITEQKKTSDLFKYQFENAPDIIFVINFDCEIIIINRGVRGFYLREELVGKNLKTILPPDSKNAVLDIINKCFDTGEPSETELCFFDAFWSRIRMVPLLFDGEPQRIMIFCTNITQEKKAENSLKVNEQKYRTLLENISDSILLLDENYEVRYQSTAQNNLANSSSLNFIGKSIIEFVHPNDIFEFTTLLNQSISKPAEALLLQARFLTPEGNYRWIEGSIKNMFGDDSVNSLVINYRDISSRKLAEQELTIAKLKAEHTAKQLALASSEIKDQELKYRTLFESSNDSFLLFYEGKWVDCNTSATKLFECTRAEIINSNPVRFSPTYQPDGSVSETIIKQHVEKVLLGESQAFEWMHCKADGTPFYAEVNLNKIELFGRPHIQAIIRDITEKKKVQEQLALSALIVNSSEDAIVSKTTEGFIITWNLSAERIFGYSAEEVIGKHGSFLVSPELQEKEEENFKEVLAGNPINQYETYRLRKDGKIIFVSLSISPIFNEQGKVIGASKILRDISEKKLLENEKAKVLNDLVQRNRDLEQFSFIVSHNLRSPVTNVMGISELLRTEGLDSDLSADLINGLSKSVTALDTVIRDLNYILQMKREVNEQHTELLFTEIVEQIKCSISNLISQENVSIQTDFSELNNFFTIKTYLYSIFYNLIFNSIKYKRENVNPVIEIKSSLQGDSLSITFKDNGLGIDLDKKGDQIFMLYKRFHHHTEGKGMGLFIVKSQVETLGGKIFVKSEVGKGTEFKIVFDLKHVS